MHAPTALRAAAAVLLFAGVGLIACGAALLGSYTCGQTAFELAVAEAEEASRPATVDSSRMLRRLHDTDAPYANTTCQPGLQGHACALCKSDLGCKVRGHAGGVCWKGLEAWTVVSLHEGVRLKTDPVGTSDPTSAKTSEVDETASPLVEGYAAVCTVAKKAPRRRECGLHGD